MGLRGWFNSKRVKPLHTYESPGVYDVSLIGTIYIYDYSVSDSIPVDTIVSNQVLKPAFVQVSGALAAAFDVDTTDGYAPLTVKFTDKSIGEPEVWDWSFGDGGTSDQPSPTHIYTEPGLYNVSLTVAKGEEINTKSISDFINVKQKLTAKFSADVTNGEAPLEVQFTDETIGEPPAVQWEWSFGDGATSLIPSPSHLYNTEGTYDVTLTVNNGTDTVSTTKKSYIKVGAAPELNAEFIAEPTSGPSPLEVQFTSQSTGDPETFIWSFGDGSLSSSEENPVHIYDFSGTFTVSLTVIKGQDEDTELKENYIIAGGQGVNDFMINSFDISQNYPNPMKDNTTIEYDLDYNCKVYVKIFNTLGEIVAILESGKVKPAGIHHLKWNGRDMSGKELPSGVYHIELSIEGFNYKFTKSKELIIIK